MKLTMSSGLKTWWTRSSADGLEMADFKRACSEIKEGIYYVAGMQNQGGEKTRATHQQAEAIFKFLEDVDEFLLWGRPGLGSE